jgi:flavin reductase (DIM6/NTAB) family NADH-FMN oxidoreductase RutF
MLCVGPSHELSSQLPYRDMTTGFPKLEVPPERWDAMFAPSSLVATVTTVDGDGAVNAASFGTCTRVCHDPVTIAFSVGAGKDTFNNVLATGEFVVNVPAFERRQLEAVRVMGLDFAPGVDEIDRAGLTALPSTQVAPPRIAEFGRHFECTVEWTKRWRDRLLVCGLVVAVTCDLDAIDDDGYLAWDVAKPFHFCGWPYENAFVPMYDVTRVDMVYAGPEATAGEREIPEQPPTPDEPGP